MGLGFFLTCHAAPFYLKVLDEENDGNYTAWFSQSGLYQNVPEKDFPPQYFSAGSLQSLWSGIQEFSYFTACFNYIAHLSQPNQTSPSFLNC